MHYKIGEATWFFFLQFLADTQKKVCVINSSYSFKAINLALRTNISGILKIEEKKIIFDKITAFLNFEMLQFLAKTLWKVCIINYSF